MSFDFQLTITYSYLSDISSVFFFALRNSVNVNVGLNVLVSVKLCGHINTSVNIRDSSAVQQLLRVCVGLALQF